MAEGKIEPIDIEKIKRLQMLREPFRQNEISKLPKPFSANAEKGKCKECGGYHGLPAMHLDYVGHAALTDRLLQVDPFWFWEPLALTADGLPLLDKDGGLWIKLTVCGITRLGYGDAQGKTGPNATKERIGDALRNAGMRFGMALDLWHKGDLWQDREDAGIPHTDAATAQPTAEQYLTIAKYQRSLNVKPVFPATQPDADAWIADYKQQYAAAQDAKAKAAAEKTSDKEPDATPAAQAGG